MKQMKQLLKLLSIFLVFFMTLGAVTASKKSILTLKPIAKPEPMSIKLTPIAKPKTTVKRSAASKAKTINLQYNYSIGPLWASAGISIESLNILCNNKKIPLSTTKLTPISLGCTDLDLEFTISIKGATKTFTSKSMNFDIKKITSLPNNAKNAIIISQDSSGKPVIEIKPISFLAPKKINLQYQNDSPLEITDTFIQCDNKEIQLSDEKMTPIGLPCTNLDIFFVIEGKKAPASQIGFNSMNELLSLKPDESRVINVHLKNNAVTINLIPLSTTKKTSAAPATITLTPTTTPKPKVEPVACDFITKAVIPSIEDIPKSEEIPTTNQTELTAFVTEKVQPLVESFLKQYGDEAEYNIKSKEFSQKQQTIAKNFNDGLQKRIKDASNLKTEASKQQEAYNKCIKAPPSTGCLTHMANFINSQNNLNNAFIDLMKFLNANGECSPLPTVTSVEQKDTRGRPIIVNGKTLQITQPTNLDPALFKSDNVTVCLKNLLEPYAKCNEIAEENAEKLKEYGEALTTLNTQGEEVAQELPSASAGAGGFDVSQGLGLGTEAGGFMQAGLHTAENMFELMTFGLVSGGTSAIDKWKSGDIQGGFAELGELPLDFVANAAAFTLEPIGDIMKGFGLSDKYNVPQIVTTALRDFAEDPVSYFKQIPGETIVSGFKKMDPTTW